MSMTDDEPVVKITLTTIYTKLLEVDAKVDPLPAQVSDHEKRIRALETRMWAAIGGFALLAAASPYLSRLIP